MMKAVAILLAAALCCQWMSSSPLTIPTAAATSHPEACETYQFYEPMEFNCTSAYAVCKNIILQPEKQLSITVTSDNIKFIIFKDNILPLIPLGTFSSFPNMTHLYLNHNGVKTLVPGIFTYLTQLQELRLQDNSITEISTGTFNTLANLTVLDLSGNTIIILGRDCFAGLVNLKNLNLNRNNLYYLERESFLSLTELEILDLSHNYLSISEPFLVIELDAENLQKLLINNNLLLRIPIFLTGNLNRLEILDVSFNALTEIDFGLILASDIANFSNNQISVVKGRPEFNNAGIDLQRNRIKYNLQIDGKIECLDLKWNEIEILNIFMFKNSVKLKELDFGHNFINEIANNFFQSLINLETLRLNNNKLTYLRVDCFVGLDFLDLLSLSHNSLRILQDGVFNGLSELRTLYLDYNELVSINENTFDALHNLRHLYLNNNLLTTINVDSLLENLPKLSTITLSNNNWDCSDLINTAESFKRHSIKLSQQYDIFKVFDLACDNFRLKVYSHQGEDENIARFMVKIISSFMLLFVLTIDVIIISWYFVYLKMTLRQSQVKMRKFEHLLAKIRNRNRDDTYYTIL